MRTLPHVGMAATVIHLGRKEEHVVEDVSADGRTLVVGGEPYALNRLTGQWVREGAPYYGPRVVLRGD